MGIQVITSFQSGENFLPISRLSVLFGTDSFRYLLADDNYSVFAYGQGSVDHPDIDSVLQSIHKAHPTASIHASTPIEIGLFTHHFTFVPNKWAIVGENETYLRNTNAIPHGFTMVMERLEPMDVAFSYAFHPSWFKTSFNNITFRSFVSPWLTYLHDVMASDKGTQVFLQVAGSKIYIAVFDGKNLLFFNQFDLKEATDVTYYTMLVFEQLQLGTDKSPLYVCGDVVEDSSIYKTLLRYVRHIFWFPDRGIAPEQEGPMAEKPSIYHDILVFHNYAKDVVQITNEQVPT